MHSQTCLSNIHPISSCTHLDLEIVILSQVNQAEKEKYHDFGKVMYTLLYLKLITTKTYLLYSTWNSAQCYAPAWMGGGLGGECMHAKLLQSCPTLCNLWTVVHQAPLSMGFSRQEHWSGLPCPPLRDRPNPGTEPRSPVSPALRVDSLPTEPPGEEWTSICMTKSLH